MPVDKEFYGDFLPSPEEVARSMGSDSDRIYNPITGDDYLVSLEPELKISEDEIDI